MEEFIRIKRAYVKARENERKKLLNFFEKNDITVINKRGGSGVKKYTSGGRLDIAFDLSNWKWIEIFHKEHYYLLSLQSFEREPSSGNIHILMDRIGIYKYKKYKSQEACDEMIVTNIDLPLTEVKMNCLLELL